MKAHLLIVDDDANTLASLSRAFRLAGHEATACDNPERALEMAKTGSYDLIFSDVVMPVMDGLTLLERIRAAGVATPVVMMSGQAHIEMAVKATRLGALDFLEKPISTDKLLLTVQNSLRMERLQQENQQLRRQLGDSGIVFTGEKMRRLMAQVERVAASETRVCIRGETGTGKELIARTMHDNSNGGVIVATHRDLEEQVRIGAFRQDLFHRVYVFPVVLPPLRERTEDIPALTTHFARQIAKQNGWKEITIAPEAIQALQAYAWPGNSRELRNVVERLLLYCDDNTVTAATLQAAPPPSSSLHWPPS